ncbi:MAK10-like protein [Tanacetum coccineum]|uniref:MAK10-like protein n=1 Tax=Tanacetum coccineum TaxID=301880 RepID=A0ABQ5CE62_9ASTR
MGDENPIRTLGDYSKPSYEGYRNTIELPVRNNMVPFRSDTFRLVQNGCSFHKLQSEDPNQHLKDFLKLIDSFDLDGENRERTRLRLFQFSLRDQACNWLERLLAGSITTWEDLTTRFLAQFFPPGRNAKLLDQSAGGKLRDQNAKESWALLEDLALYDNKSWNDLRDFAKPIKAITLPQDDPMNRITISCDIWSGPHDTQYCMEDPEQAFVEYASLRTDEIGEPEPTLEDEFQDFHLKLPILEVIAHTPIYNAILDKYMESLKLGKNGSTFIQGEVSTKMEDPELFTQPCRLGDSKPFNTLTDLGSCVNIIPLYLFKKLNIGLLEETDHIFRLADGTKSYPVGIVKDVKVHIGKQKLLNDFYVIDMKKDPETPLLVGRGFLATTNAVIDCRMAKIAVGKEITRKDFLDYHLPREWEIARDAEINPFKDVLMFRRMVEFLGAIPINLKSNMWESEDLIKNPIN